MRKKEPWECFSKMSVLAYLRRHDWIGEKQFYKELFFLTLPIILQQLVNTLFAFTDNLMVGMVTHLHL